MGPPETWDRRPVLQQRAYSAYRQMAAETVQGERPTLLQTAERLAAIQADAEGGWLFRLWLELLAQAGRDDKLRELAGGFWSTTRTMSAEGIRQAYEEEGTDPPAAPDRLATAMIALDIGLALQHFVDPEAVPLDAYTELYPLLFEPLAPTASTSPPRRRAGARGRASRGGSGRRGPRSDPS